jgi:sarcosine oxidase
MFDNYVQNHFRGLSAHTIKAVPCLYTVTPDHQFIIDRHPSAPQVIVASPCCGRGFKHSAAIGEVLSQMIIDNQSSIPIEPFSFSRFTGVI